MGPLRSVPIVIPTNLHPSLRRGCRSLIGDGNDASQMILFRPSRHDLPPIAEKFSAPVRRIVSVIKPTTSATSVTNDLTIGNILDQFGYFEAIQIERIEMQAVGARIASFQVFQFIGNEQLSTSVEDCAPPNAWPGVEVEFAMGARPTFASTQADTRLVFTASSEAHKLYCQVTCILQI